MFELLALIVIIGLAGYRVARAITVDKVSEPLRKHLYRWTYDNLEGAAPKKFRLYWYNLLTCQLCTGFWVTLVLGLVASAQNFDLSVFMHIVVALAACGFQVMLAFRENTE